MRVVIILSVLALLLILFLLNRKPASSGEPTEWAVYGTMGCGWTRKQLEDMDSKGIKYNFIDCDKEECAGMEAFPTVKSLKTGKVNVGFISL
jgi:hypothetical protein